MIRTNKEHTQQVEDTTVAQARIRIEEAHHDEATTQMLLEIRKHNPAFDYEGLDEEVAQALLDLAYYGERHREHLTRYARQRANQFVWAKASTST